MEEIHGYSLTEKIYESDRSIVYRALDNNTGKSYVIKVFNKAHPSQKDVRRFNNELKILSALNDDRIIKCLDKIDLEGIKALVLEDIGAHSLFHYIHKGGFDIDSFLRIAIPFTEAVGYLHRQNIIHKDINPGNIIYNEISGALKIIDFDIAVGIKREIQPAINPGRLEGTLSYISPEQTGRMNRTIDFRTDYYSLGVTFFHMLTGRLPFQTGNITELIHSHIVLAPPTPREIDPDIPDAVSSVVMKLMSKNAEDRYQSSVGLKSDLEKCLTKLSEDGGNRVFQIGADDISETLSIPEKLYGRDEEIGILMDEFGRAAEGSPGIVFVSGPSGIGKSCLINEIQKPLVQKRGYFISGKFEQFKRDIPNLAFIQAIRDIVRQIMTESEAELNKWRSEILGKIEASGRVITGIIPELELIIGNQPDVPDLSPSENENRFRLIFRMLMDAFASHEHPLVLFIDDLQWADIGSIKLMQMLFADKGISHILFIGAYRDNEVGRDHPLMAFFREMEKSDIAPECITLKPLEPDNINRLISDTLKRDDGPVKELAQLVKTRTLGNPFFVKEFMTSLYRENFLSFHDGWFFNVKDIVNANISDNVVAFLTERVNKLTDDALDLLKYASCVGVTCDLDLLSALSGKDPQAILFLLNDAINDGLLFKLEGVLKFAHDRIRDAVYSLIEESEREKIHHRIGDQMIKTIPADRLDDFVFAVVNQFNSSINLIVSDEERRRLIQLNIKAGLKAKASTAYMAARDFFEKCRMLLQPDHWASEYDLSLQIYTELGETGYLSGDHDLAEKYLNDVLQKVNEPLDKIRAYEIKMAVNTSMHRTREALQWGRDALKLLDAELPSSSHPLIILKELVKIKIKLGKKSADEIMQIPEMTDCRQLAIARILMECTEPSYIGDPGYLPIIAFKLLGHSLDKGNSKYSSYAYAVYGLMLCGILNDIENGYKYGKLSLALLEQYKARELGVKILFLYGNMINHWKHHLKSSIEYFTDAMALVAQTGDIVWYSYCINYVALHHFFVGMPLPEVKSVYMSHYQQIRTTKQDTAIQAYELWCQLVMNLSEDVNDVTKLSGEMFNEDTTLPFWIKNNDLNSQGFYTVGKQILNYLFGEYLNSIDCAEKGAKSIASMTGMYFVPLHYFYHSLALCGQYGSASKKERKKYFKRIVNNQKKMKKWAEHAPMNYLHKYLLVEAELFRIRANTKDAGDAYARSADLARENGFLHEEAIACELAAGFYLSLEMEKFASNFMTRSCRCYELWGARHKAALLREKYGLIIMM